MAMAMAMAMALFLGLKNGPKAQSQASKPS
jgi:hypothetical protein